MYYNVGRVRAMGSLPHSALLFAETLTVFSVDVIGVVSTVEVIVIGPTPYSIGTSSTCRSQMQN